ncbi:MAG: transcription antitermination factor NusB, partial [Erysipelotrichaceae bacterium]|nr:transcription antitermination factor NusB [Erysipelotrichaceae bacterium]
SLIKTTLINKDSYIQLLNKNLKKGWTFERLGMMEKAILLIATCEMLEFDTPKEVAINEAVLNAKKFCEDDAYKFINGVLSKVI